MLAKIKVVKKKFSLGKQYRMKQQKGNDVPTFIESVSVVAREYKLPKIEIIDIISACLKEEMGDVKIFTFANNSFTEESIITIKKLEKEYIAELNRIKIKLIFWYAKEKPNRASKNTNTSNNMRHTLAYHYGLACREKMDPLGFKIQQS